MTIGDPIGVGRHGYTTTIDVSNRYTGMAIRLASIVKRSIPPLIIGAWLKGVIPSHKWRPLLIAFAFHETIRYIVQRIAMIIAYPAQSTLFSFFVEEFSNSQLEEIRETAPADSGEISRRHFYLRHKGVSYSAIAVSYSDFENNWVLHAPGNGQPIEHIYRDKSSQYSRKGYHSLFVNSAGVGLSGGEANPTTMADAQEAGLLFLKNHLEARKIRVVGHSIGGGAAGLMMARLPKRTTEDISLIRTKTFNRLSTTAYYFLLNNLEVPKAIAFFVPYIVKWAGLEIDSVKASRKIGEMDYPETIIQCGRDGDGIVGDGIIADGAALAQSIEDENIEGKTVKLVWSGHNESGHVGTVLESLDPA